MTSLGAYFRSAFDAYVTARERQAQRYVNGALLTLDDKTLAGLGYTREELKKLSSAYLI